MKSRGLNRLRRELPSYLAKQEMVRGQWNTASWIRALISQRTGIKKNLHPGMHCDQLLIMEHLVSWLNLHVTPSTAVLLSSFCLSNWLTSFFNSPTAPTKFVPLSHIASLGTPRRLVKRVKAFRNVSVSSPQAISKCTACISRQVNRHSHLFWRGYVRPWMVYRGPAKSMAAWAKGWKVKRSLVFGSGAIIWQSGLFRLFLHSLHAWSHSRISSRAAIMIQNLSLKWQRMKFNPAAWFALSSVSQSVLSPSARKAI